MIKKSVTFTNFNGEKVTKDYYFHLSKAELMDMRLVHGDGLEGRVRAMVASNDRALMLKEFKDLLRQTVGERSEDGNRFIKTTEIADAFMQSPAFDEVYQELLTGTSAAVEFIRGIVPDDLRGRVDENAELKALAAQSNAEEPLVVKPEGPVDLAPEDPIRPVWNGLKGDVSTLESPKLFGEMTEEELTELSPEEFEKLFAQVSADEEATAHQKGFYDFSRTELLGMTDEEFTALVGNNPRKWDKVQRVVAMQRRTASKRK